MQNVRKRCIVGLVGVLLFSPYALSQTRQPNQNEPGGISDLYDKLVGTGPGGPAPRRDLTGFWAGRVAQKINEVPPLTPFGQEQFATHKNESQYIVAESNDPMKSCDPLGFPRNMLFQTRGIALAQMPGRMLELFQYNRVWREIWTDGRELPKNVGGRSADAPDPRWYGYSVGHWDGDYSFVVDTVGSDDRSWLDQVGHPHSIDMRVKERYTRLDHNTLEVTITIDDPKMYTKPFVISQVSFKWIPQQDFEEEICAPSVMAEYLKVIADPAGKGPGK
jgi:hypothetical protein